MAVYSVYAAAPAEADSLKRTADMYFARHDYTRAAGIYRSLFAADSTDATVATLLASCLLRDSRYGEAVPLYEKALRLNPELKLCQLGLVDCNYKLGRIEEASRWASRVRSELEGRKLADWDSLVEQMFPLIRKPEKK
ncbi:tetratricopeptide repeat protein [bacterium]|nr:tetratricopeptide repeat protein [bacterium]